MINLEKITPLKPEEIKKILDNSQEVGEIAAILRPHIQELLKGEFSDLRKLKTKDDFEKGFDRMIEFLHKIGLVGSEKDSGEYLDDKYSISPQGISIVNAFYRNKAKNLGLKHKVKVVECGEHFSCLNDEGKEIPFSRFINAGFLNALKQDLKEVKIEDEFEQIYVLESEEVFYGNNHFCTVTIRKKAGEIQPLVDLFDPSPSLVRSGLGSCQDKISWTLFTPYIVLATVNGAFKEKGLELVNEKFFQNLEPFQAEGFKYCSTFALEHAYFLAKMSRKEHEKMLEKYSYECVFGGRSEIGLTYEEIVRSYEDLKQRRQTNEKAKSTIGVNKKKTLDSPVVAMSHFNSQYDADRKALMASKTYITKKQEEKNYDQRRNEYLRKDGTEKERNILIQQKSLRHRVHLFEIVSSDEFLKLGQDFLEKQGLENLSGSGEKLNEQIEKRLLKPKAEVSMSRGKSGGLDETELKSSIVDAFGIYCYKAYYSDHERDIAKLEIRCSDETKEKIEKIFAEKIKSGKCKIDLEKQFCGADFGGVKVNENFKQRNYIRLEVEGFLDIVPKAASVRKVAGASGLELV